MFRSDEQGCSVAEHSTQSVLDKSAGENMTILSSNPSPNPNPCRLEVVISNGKTAAEGGPQGGPQGGPPLKAALLLSIISPSLLHG